MKKYGNTIKRREFLNHFALAFLSGVVVTLTSCGTSEEEETSLARTQNTQGKTGSISSNHGHSALITSAQLASNQMLTLNIQGSGNHSHSLVLSPSELGAIRQGTRISKYSSSQTDGHAHTVTFN